MLQYPIKDNRVGARVAYSGDEREKETDVSTGRSFG